MNLNKLLINKLQFSISILTILAAIFSIALRLSLFYINDYKQQISTSLTTMLQTKVTIGAIEAQIFGLTPQLRLNNLKLYPPHQPPLHLKQIQLQLDTIASLRHRQIRLAGLTIDGVQLNVQLNPDLKLSWELNANSNSTKLPLHLLLSHGHLSLLNGSIHLERPNNSPLIIQPVTILLEPRGNTIQLEILAELENQGNLQLLAEINLITKTTAKFYLKTENLVLKKIIETWLKPILATQFKFNGILNTEIWGQWNTNQIDLAGSINLHDLEINMPKKFITNVGLTTNINWHWQTHKGWNAVLSNLTWQLQDQDYGEIELDLRSSELTTIQYLKLAITELAIEDLITSAALLPLPDAIFATIQTLQPHGQIQDLTLELALLPNALPNWTLNTQINELSFKPIAKIPGINGLDLNIRANSNAGTTELNANKMTLIAPRLFRSPLTNLHLTGNMQWQYAPDHKLILNSRSLTLENEDLYTHLRLNAQLPLTSDPPFLDLQGTINGDVATLYRYFPVGVMKKPLIDWLDQALVAGNLANGNFILRGVATDFPFRTNQGRFDAILDISDLTLEYQKDWPRLEKAEGEVRFLGPGLAINLRQANLLNSKINGAEAFIADIKPAPHLPISGRATGPFTDAMQILRGPLAATHGRYTTGMEVQGDSELALKVAIPIEPWVKLQLDGQIFWRDAELKMVEWGIDLQNIAGNLHFTDKGLFAQGISANLAQEQLDLNVDTPITRLHKNKETNLDINVALTNELLSTLAPSVTWDMLSGTTQAHLQLSIPHNVEDNALTKIKFFLQSDLNGLTINLPAPLNKTANTDRHMFIKGILPLTIPQQLYCSYGELKAALRTQSVVPLKITAGEITSNLNIDPTTDRSGLNISGQIQRLDIPGWLTWLKTSKTSGLELPPVQTTVHIDDLGFTNMPIKDLMLELKQTVDGLNAQILAPNLKGQIKVPLNPRLEPIQAQFNLIRLEWPENKDDFVSSPLANTLNNNAATLDAPDPQQAPALDLQIENLQLGSQSLGTMKAIVRADPNGLNLKQLDINGSLFNIKGRGSWIGTKEMQETQLHLEGKSANFGQTLRSLGFTSALEQASLQMQANLNWSAPPHAIALEILNGDLDLRMGAGRVADVDPGVGRLFGLLSLETIQRRLSLDFSDLFRKGFAFDTLTGTFTLNNGDAFAQSIKIIGPAASINVSGRTGLVAQDYDQLILVTPYISSTLPVAGALAAGPIAAAALLVAGQVMGDEVNHLARLQYRLVGPWEHAELTRIETQDGWSVSNLLIPNSK